MAVFPQDKRGQLELVFFILALAVLYFAWAGTPIGGIPGASQLAKSRDSLSREVDSIQTRVDQAKRLVRQGAVARVERALRHPARPRAGHRDVRPDRRVPLGYRLAAPHHRAERSAYHAGAVAHRRHVADPAQLAGRELPDQDLRQAAGLRAPAGSR